MGSFNKCCCCLSKKTSAIVCTVIMFLLYLHETYSDIKNVTETENNVLMDIIGLKKIHYILDLCMSAIVFITLIVLLIGIVKDRVPLMKPFNIIFLIYIILSVIYSVYIFIKVRMFLKNLSSEDLEKYNDRKVDFDNFDFDDDYLIRYHKYTMDEFKELIDTSSDYYIVSLIISTIINTIYYITTRNYIKSVEDEEKEVEDIKNMESAN